MQFNPYKNNGVMSFFYVVIKGTVNRNSYWLY